MVTDVKGVKKSVIRQRPRLLYAGVNDKGAGWLTEKQTTDNAELMLIGKGSGKIEIGDGTYPFIAGDLVICNRGCEHREYFDETPDHEFLFAGIGNLHIFGMERDTLLKDKAFCVVHTQEYFPALQAYMRQLVAEAEGVQPLCGEIAAHLLKILLLFVVRLVSYDSGLTFGENRNYLQAKEYFDEHFLEIESLDTVCKSLFINKYYLSHLFTQNEGMPPVRYLIGKRIELACKLLETSDDNVGDIGKACGYADPCYFSRTFKKVKGVTPLRYRYLFKLDKSGKKEE